MSEDRSVFREEAFALRGQREPIDGLLQVTAPHEWAILAGLVLAALAVVGWGFLGSVERGLRAGCVLAVPGERYGEAFGLSAEPDTVPGLEAVSLLDVSEARQVSAGMTARISTSDRTLAGSEILDAQVLEVSEHAVDLRGRLDDIGLALSARSHVVRLALDSLPSAVVADGDACSVQIVLERHPPVFWLTSADRR